MKRDAHSDCNDCTTKELHIAPMLDVTGREFRQLMRILSKRCVLWTEMVVDTTILYTNEMNFHLAYEQDNSHPIICQIGGSDADQLRTAARTVLDYGYDEINFNMDCPSNRVASKRQFGAVLMKQPEIAAGAVGALCEAVRTHREDTDHNEQRENGASNSQFAQLSVKTRIGVDDMTSLEDSVRLIRRLDEAGCKIFHLHSRSAILGGTLNPGQNRSIPPLHYKHVYDLCRLFPHCKFYLNGGIKTLVAAKEICYGRKSVQGNDNKNDDNTTHGVVPCQSCGFPNGSCIAPPSSAKDVPPNLCGVLLGRVALDNPCLLWDVDRYFYGDVSNPCTTRRQILDQYVAYINRVYPRRCCDQNPVKMTKITDGKDYDFEYDYCCHCVDIWCGVEAQHLEMGTVAPVGFTEGNSESKEGKNTRKCDTTKISINVMYRSVKPIQNIFFGLPKSQLFRRECDELIHSLQIRNCGPAALIQRALKVIPDELLNRPLLPADTMLEKNDHFSFDEKSNAHKSNRSNEETSMRVECGHSQSECDNRMDSKQSGSLSLPRKQPGRSQQCGVESRSQLSLLLITCLLSLLQGKAVGWYKLPVLGRLKIPSNPRQHSSFAFSKPFFVDREPPFIAIITEPDACSTDEKVKSTIKSIEQALQSHRVDLISIRLQGSAATCSPQMFERACMLTQQLLDLSQRRNDLGVAENRTVDTEDRIPLSPLFCVVCSSDWVPVAARTRAHGIHVKEAHLNNIPDWVHSFDYGILVGTSTHSVESALKSWSRYHPDYYFVGTCFLTESHPEKNESELEGPSLPGKIKMTLQDQNQSETSFEVPPVFAIGGIDETNCMIPIRSGADGVAVIRAVLQADRPDHVVTSMYNRMKDAWIRIRQEHDTIHPQQNVTSTNMNLE